MGNPFAELGLSSEDGTMTIDHAIALSMTKSIEAALLQTLTTLTKSSKDMNRVFKVLGYAAASYLFFSGVTKRLRRSFLYLHAYIFTGRIVSI